MNPGPSNNMDLLKNSLGLGALAPLEKAAKGMAAEKSQGKAADEKRWKAALDFEAMFLGQMYKAMRKTTMSEEGGDLTEAGPGRQIFTEMLDTQYANMNAKNPSISGPQGLQNAISGISNSLAAQVYRSMSRQEGQTAVSGAPSTAATPMPLALSKPVSLAGAVKAEGMFSTAPFLARIIGDRARSGKSTAVSSLPDEKLNPYVALASKTYGVAANLIKSVIRTESNNQPLAVSGAGAKGLMQLMDSTAKDLGVRNVFNAQENVLAGTRYLKQMLDRFKGDEKMALAAYNAGPGTVERFKGVPPYAETIAYVEKVQKTRKNLDAAAQAGTGN